MSTAGIHSESNVKRFHNLIIIKVVSFFSVPVSTCQIHTVYSRPKHSNNTNTCKYMYMYSVSKYLPLMIATFHLPSFKSHSSLHHPSITPLITQHLHPHPPTSYHPSPAWSLSLQFHCSPSPVPPPDVYR